MKNSAGTQIQVRNFNLPSYISYKRKSEGKKALEENEYDDPEGYYGQLQ